VGFYARFAPAFRACLKWPVEIGGSPFLQRRMSRIAANHEDRSHTMTHDDARRLLGRLGVEHTCDLDLLIFFARYPRALLSSESLAGFLGYDLKEIADSLEVLMDAGLLTRAQSAAHAARLYAFAVDPTTDDWLPSLLAFVSTREGRLAVRQALSRRREPSRGGAAPLDRGAIKPGPRRVVEPSKRRARTA
jgi:hypothetical protein